MAPGDRDLVTRLLKQSILTLCREAVTYNSRLEVDGIICLTADDEEQHVVKIHEFFNRPKESEAHILPVRKVSSIGNSSVESFYPSHSVSNEDVQERKIICNLTNKLSGKDKVKCNSIEMEIPVIKTEPKSLEMADTDKQTVEDTAENDSQHELQSDMHTYSDNISNVDYTRLGFQKFTMSSAKNIHCRKCNSMLENVELFQIHNMTSHNHFTCLVCLATFTSRNNMKRHIRLHTGIKPYSCHKCPESFSRNDDFKRHLLKHTFQKPFRCATCKTGYSDRSCIKSHMIKEHNSKVFHVCSQCGESYTDIMKFQQHKKSHPEFQDYRCSICSFTGSSALMYNKHMLTHGPLKEYRCTHCDLSYSDPFMYSNHLKKHKGDELVQSFTCCFCDMSLTSFDQFQRHEHTHVHSKQHVCEVCNKVFRYPSNLREHMLIHLPKSSFPGAKYTKSTFGLIDFQIPKDEDTFSSSKRDDSSDVHDMDTEEENNNKIDVNVEENFENETNKVDTSGCSDYWCTECSHGFGTEGELQNHIICKHEKKNENAESQNDEVNERKVSKNSVTLHDSFEMSTQMNVDTDVIYNEDTQLVMSIEHSVNDESINNTPSLHEGQCPSKNEKRIRKASSIVRSKQFRTVYDEDTVVDKSDSQTDADSANEVMQPHRDTEIDLNTVTDAMRQVKSIQSRFGIKSVGTFRARHSNELFKRLTADETNDNHRHSWPNPTGTVSGMSGQTDKQSEAPISVSVSGLKLKLHRGTNVSSDNLSGSLNNSETKSISTGMDSSLLNVTNGISVQKDTISSGQVSPYSRSSVLGMNTEFSGALNRSSSTSLNLKVRNPGFERVVTPEVLFKTKAPFTCEVCEETFENFDDFHGHGVKVHRRFICSYCGKVFTSRPNRERHIRYHTGEKPYKCELCSATFLRGDDLKYHRTTKHTDIKPFMCGACQTSFSLPKDLEKHLKIYPDHRL